MDSNKLLKEIVIDEIIKNKLGLIKESVLVYSRDREIRKTIRKVLAKKMRIEERIEKVIKEDIDKIPYNSTAVNVLKDLLKKIIPILESSYKMLTSDREQRKSFEAHMIVGIKNSIGMAKLSRDTDEKLSDLISGSDIKQYIGPKTTPEVDDALSAYDEAVPNANALQEEPPPINTIKELANALTSSLSSIYRKTLLEKKILQREATGIDFNKFSPKEKEPVKPTSQESPAFLDIDNNKPQIEEPVVDKTNGLDSTKYNETGRNLAIDAFSKIEKSIVAAYNLLADSEDRKIFYIYLIANIVMHFRRFEDELNASLQSSDVIPQQSLDKIDQASLQNPAEIGKVIERGTKPSANISTPASPSASLPLIK